MIKKQQIIFEASADYSEELTLPPLTGTKFVPRWYKEQKLFSNKESDYIKAKKTYSPFEYTYKLCTPLVDSLTSGYFLSTSADIAVINIGTESNYIPEINWRVSWGPLDSQSNDVLGNYPVPDGYSKKIFRWSSDWKIKLPKGYSLWVTHPSHRHDLPFFTLNGFVDSDKHVNPLLFPFFIKNGFEGIIEQGTPIAQLIPVKREFWKSKIVSFEEKNNIKSVILNNIRQNILRSYKNKFWSKKHYE